MNKFEEKIEGRKHRITSYQAKNDWIIERGCKQFHPVKKTAMEHVSGHSIKGFLHYYASLINNDSGGCDIRKLEN
jgi:hypothetical protein